MSSYPEDSISRFAKSLSPQPTIVKAGSSGCLFGRDASQLGDIYTAQGRNTAIAISRGGARKLYGTAVSNEDAVLFLEHDNGFLIAVADAHKGPEASELAIEMLATLGAAHPIVSITDRDISIALTIKFFCELNDRIILYNGENSKTSQTTLALCVYNRFKNQVFAASAGDSEIFAVGADGATSLAGGLGAGEFFLGKRPIEEQEIFSQCGFELVSSGGKTTLIAMTDGLLTNDIGFTDPLKTIHNIVTSLEAKSDSSARAIARELVAQGSIAQAGNNAGDDIGVSVGRL